MGKHAARRKRTFYVTAFDEKMKDLGWDAFRIFFIAIEGITDADARSEPVD